MLMNSATRASLHYTVRIYLVVCKGSVFFFFGNVPVLVTRRFLHFILDDNSRVRYCARIELLGALSYGTGCEGSLGVIRQKQQGR